MLQLTDLPYFLTPLPPAHVHTYTMYNWGVEALSLEKEEVINTIITGLQQWQHPDRQESSKRGNTLFRYLIQLWKNSCLLFSMTTSTIFSFIISHGHTWSGCCWVYYFVFVQVFQLLSVYSSLWVKPLDMFESLNKQRLFWGYACGFFDQTSLFVSDQFHCQDLPPTLRHI